MSGTDAPAAVVNVFITEELSRRPALAADHLREKRALQDLAGRMAGHPDEVLPRFVDLAMELTGGVSAGLSLYEENPAPGVFRWQYLRGSLSPFNGALTPRNFSPCGITLDQNRPVLSAHPERVYDWISDAQIVVPEVLLVPLFLGAGEALGTLWIVSDTEGHFNAEHARIATELASFATIALHMLRNETRLRLALDEQETLAQEMNHRVKNLFAITDGMIRISAKDAGDKDAMTSILSGRIRALASAHALLRQSASDRMVNDGKSDFAALLNIIVAPHQGAAGSGPRFSMEGPAALCGPQATTGIALIFHEMATNAAKHGALRDESGQVAIRWLAAGGDITIHWVERGGPELSAERGHGLGTKLLNDTVTRQFGGALSYELKPSGLVAAIILPLDALAR